MRLLLGIRTLLRSGDSVVAFGLLAAAVLVSPPRDSGLRLALVMVSAIVVIGAALHIIRRVSGPDTSLARMGSWARATAALGASASVLMIFDATVSALG